MAARRDSWNDVDDAYLQIQVKSDGVFCEDGVTPRPNDTTSRGVKGRASFNSCTGYGDMAIVFVKSRLDTASGEVQRKIWVMDGAEVQETMTENIDGTLGTNRVPHLTTTSAIELDEALENLVLEAEKPLVTLNSIWMDVESESHRKEMLLMLSVQ